MPTDPRWLVGPDTSEIVDRLLGDFLLSCLGKNDMSVANGMIISAVMLIKAHCERTGQDYDETVQLFRSSFETLVEIVKPK